jgi:hypothetical protein
MERRPSGNHFISGARHRLFNVLHRKRIDHALTDQDLAEAKRFDFLKDRASACWPLSARAAGPALIGR